MGVYAQIAEKIIAQQETIIGPVAVQQAEQVSGIKLDWAKHEVELTGNEPSVIDKLVGQYKALFGQLAVETCKEAAARDIAQLSPEQVPSTLK